jgi:hypothetical protein
VLVGTVYGPARMPLEGPDRRLRATFARVCGERPGAQGPREGKECRKMTLPDLLRAMIATRRARDDAPTA